MAVLSTPRFPVYSRTTSRTDKLVNQKVLPWLASTFALVLGLTLLKSALIIFLLKLYDYLIQKNMLKL